MAVEAPALTTDEDEPQPRRVRDVAFWLFFTLYTLGAILVLAQGAGAVWAHLSKHTLASLQLRELGTGLTARIASRMARASFRLPSALSVVLGYAFSLFN